MTQNVLLLIFYLAPLLVILGLYSYVNHARNRKNQAFIAESYSAGLQEPASLHPLIDESRCIGCGACVKACPEHDVLGLVQAKVTLMRAANCIGHGACQIACPVGAIDLVFGTATRGVDIPTVHEDFQSSVSGLYIAGELGGMGLIRNAIEQGRQAMEALVAALDVSGESRVHSDALLDAIVIGVGPAGIAASLCAKAHNLNYLAIDQEADLGGTVAHFPRGKLVMTQPATLPLVGKVMLTETTKENLLSFWNEVLEQHPLRIRFSEQVVDIEQNGDAFTVKTNRSSYRSRRVLLAIGRRGTPRKLGIPGEELDKVVYRLIDPEQYRNQSILVVGGGDSALEAAISLSETHNTKVTLVYRGESFNRAKPRNRELVSAAGQQGVLQIHLNSTPLAIESNAVRLMTASGPLSIENDAVIVCVGGELPTTFLKKIGVDVETKHGTA